MNALVEKEKIKAIFNWDIATWSRALPVWDKIIQERPFQSGLEIGANKGGGSLYLALKGIKTICSDIVSPKEKASFDHHRFMVTENIDYQAIDGTQIPFPDNFFDIIIFKSVLGYLKTLPAQFDMISEIHRVLKPGGVLLFAENLQGSLLHRKARQWFVPWGKAWRYLSLAEMHRLLSVFSQYELHTTGFLAAFAPGNERIKSILARVDAALPFIPTNWRYVGYGYALK